MKVCNISISDQTIGYHNGNSYTKHVYMDGERVASNGGYSYPQIT